MTSPKPQRIAPQVAQTSGQTPAKTGTQSPAKRKRIYHLMPELRSQVPGLFDRVPADYVAEQFGVPVRDVLEEAIRDLRGSRRGPALQLVAARRVA